MTHQIYIATGRVGAIGQIHLICNINYEKTNGD